MMIMPALRLLAAALAAASTTRGQHAQVPLLETSYPTIKQVAIIGAGSAGTSTAYYLRQYANNASIPVNITIYERNSYIGGRSTTVHPWNNPSSRPLELGASIFVQVNWNLVNATRDFGLETSSYRPTYLSNASDLSLAPSLGVYDGISLVYTQQNDDLSYWDIAKLIFHYGLAPFTTRRAMRDTVGRFLQLYSPPFFPFADLTTAVRDVGLADAVATTGEAFLVQQGVLGEFGHEIVQASTRVNYAANLDAIHGVETMVCMAAEGAMSVKGGNWRVFEAMARRSGAGVELGAEVRRVARGEEGKLVVTTAPAKRIGPRGEDGGVEGEDFEAHEAREWSMEFDEVVLAAPYQFADVEWADGLCEHVPDAIPYVELHVTLFTSRHRLEPTVFGQKATELAPRAILTTTHIAERTDFMAPKVVDVETDFFSISLLHELENPHTKSVEYAYKIFTPAPVNSTFLGRILGLGGLQPDAKIDEQDISWIFRKLWHSYPVESPRVTFEPLSLGKNLWYTSGIESFISTMETSSLMGKNVARLIVDGLEQQKHKAEMAGMAAQVENGHY